MHPLLDSLLSLIFPDRCVACGTTGTLFCQHCIQSLRPYPPDPRALPPGLHHASVMFTFEGPLREAIHRLKYQNQPRLAQPLGALLAQHLQHHPELRAAVLAAPLHPNRLAERGYNQAELLARELARHSGLAMAPAGLSRVKATAQQAHQIDAQARQQNMQDAFMWNLPTAPPPRILLVDDVLTTGATLAACGQALLAAGSQAIYGIALGRTRLE